MIDTVKIEMVEKGKKRLELFSWEKCCKETESVYSKVV